MKAIIILSALGLATMFVGVYNFKKALLPMILLGLLAIIGVNTMEWNTNLRYYNDMLYIDNWAVVFTNLILGVSILIFLLSGKYFKSSPEHLEDNYAIILFTIVGAILMVSYSNIVMLFIGIETLSISLYILAGSKKNSLASNEASLKYFLMGSFATGFLLFGIVLLYGASGTFDLKILANYVAGNHDSLPAIFYVGVLLMMIGLAFKVSIVPFHFWTADVYEGSPTLITAFMATVVKIAGFAAFLRLFFTCFSGISEHFIPILTILAVLTMFLGNITAVYQNNFKRMLAFSSIAHAGYMLLAIIALKEASFIVILLYTAAYSVATITAFAVLLMIKEAHAGNDSIETFNGLAKRSPFIAFALLLAMLSLAGIPITGGFFAKYYLFANTISAGYTWLVVVAVFNSAIGVFYYFKVIIASYFKEGIEEKLTIYPAYKLVLIITTIATLLLGILPGLITEMM
jgi:NADH-quinone oxidoreductase subunit N